MGFEVLICIYLVPNWGLRFIRDLRSINLKDLSKIVAIIHSRKGVRSLQRGGQPFP